VQETQALPLWVIPLIPLFAAGLWMVIMVLLSEVGGWRVLARRYPAVEGAPRDAVRTFRMASIDLRRGALPLPVNYGNCAKIAITPAGLHLGVMVFFRFRHPPLLIPWTEIGRLQPGRLVFWRTLTIHPDGTGIRIRMMGTPAEAVAEVARQLATRMGEPAPV
jgi:hypothetical protein